MIIVRTRTKPSSTPLPHNAPYYSLPKEDPSDILFYCLSNPNSSSCKMEATLPPIGCLDSRKRNLFHLALTNLKKVCNTERFYTCKSALAPNFSSLIFLIYIPALQMDHQLYSNASNSLCIVCLKQRWWIKYHMHVRKGVKPNIPDLKYIVNQVHVDLPPQAIPINKDLILFFTAIRGSMHSSRHGAFPSLQIYACSQASLPSKLYRLMSFHWNTHSPITCPDPTVTLLF